MATNDEKEKEQFDYAEYYRKMNDPAKAGADAYKRSLTDQLSSIKGQQQATSKTYSDLYSQMKSQATRQSALGGSQGLTGGIARQEKDYMSAAQMSALGQVMSSQESAMRNLESQKATAHSNALLEAQQAQEYARVGQQNEMARLAQVEEVLKGRDLNDLTYFEKQQLTSLGFGETDYSELSKAQEDAKIGTMGSRVWSLSGYQNKTYDITGNERKISTKFWIPDGSEIFGESTVDLPNGTVIKAPEGARLGMYSNSDLIKVDGKWYPIVG